MGAAGEEFGVEIGFAQAEVVELEHARPRPLLHAQRIELGDQVAAVGVDLDQARDRALLGGARRVRGAEGPRPAAAWWRAGDSGLYRGVNLFTRAAIACSFWKYSRQFASTDCGSVRNCS